MLVKSYSENQFMSMCDFVSILIHTVTYYFLFASINLIFKGFCVKIRQRVLAVDIILESI